MYDEDCPSGGRARENMSRVPESCGITRAMVWFRLCLCSGQNQTSKSLGNLLSLRGIRGGGNIP